MISIGPTFNGLWKSWHWITKEVSSERKLVAETACGKEINPNDVKLGTHFDVTCRRCIGAMHKDDIWTER